MQKMGLQCYWYNRGRELMEPGARRGSGAGIREILLGWRRKQPVANERGTKGISRGKGKPD
jgi:hypothetical protein